MIARNPGTCAVCGKTINKAGTTGLCREDWRAWQKSGMGLDIWIQMKRVGLA